MDALWLAVPVFFASFGFHGSLPSLTNYLGANTPALRKALLWGSLIPLGVYIAWQTVTLGVLTVPEQALLAPETDVAHFIHKLVGSAGGGTLLSTLANVFAFLAIATSFLGVGLALFDYLSESLPTCPVKVPYRLRSALLAFGVPLAFALFYPQGFIRALEFAGVALALLAVVLPSVSAIRMRGRYPAEAYKAPVPTWLLGLLSFVGVLVIGIELKKVLF
jgi:tyrosine-specific transport protein